MASLDPPPKSRMAKWRLFGLRAASSLIWGDGPLFFDGGERESGKFSHANIFFLYIYGCGFCCKRFLCVCLRQFLQPFFFFLHFFSVYSLCKQFISNSPTPVKKIIVRPLERCIPLNLCKKCNSTVFEI